MIRRVITTVAAAFIAVLVVAVPTSFASTSALTFSPIVVTLGHVPVGTTIEEAVTLTNTGSDALTLNSFEAFGYNGNFTVNPGTCTLGTTLAGGQSAKAAPSASSRHPPSSAPYAVNSATPALVRRRPIACVAASSGVRRRAG